MVFYKVEALRDSGGAQKELSRGEMNSLAIELSEKSETFFQKSDQKSIVVTVRVTDGGITFAIIAPNESQAQSAFLEYTKSFPFEFSKYRMEEITFSTLYPMLTNAFRGNFINDNEDLLESFGLIDLSSRQANCEFGEALVDVDCDREEIEAVADDLLFGKTMLPEIARIYEKSAAKNPHGHPVHYLLRTDDRDVRKAVCKNLLSALYNNGRIKNRRYTFMNYHEFSNMPSTTCESLYKSSEGGAIVIRFECDLGNNCEFGKRGNELIVALCEIAFKYRQKVLTIFCMPKSSGKSKDIVLMNWGNTPFVELYEDVVFDTKAVDYLKKRAKENHVRCDKKLIGKISVNKGYTGAELNAFFDNWYQHKLCNEIYPQYKMSETVKAKIKNEAPIGSSYERLQSLIGLKNAKDVMNQALNYFKVQKIFADKGLKNERPSMHMIFTGNPGTAKTTVARLFAEIMKENDLLENDEIHEVGRADLVGKFVGHTAPLVKAAFKQAKGGVLFIDEAYSLVDDRDGMFGDEAINTIVQEMENNRDDTIVIFAGYPDKMEGFLNKNPGLRSRIAFHIPFEDYNAEELCQIAELIAKEKGFSIDCDAKEKLVKVFDKASKNSDFGNGRYARNVIEKAKLQQANRLINMNFEQITEKDVFTLKADDFELESKTPDEKVIKIGFCA